MSIWKRTCKEMPPLNEEVLILYKDKDDELKEENLLYGFASRILDSSFGFERWTYFTEYSQYYEVVFWTPLVDKPHIKEVRNEQRRSYQKA